MNGEPLFFQHGDLRPAGSGFGELACGEAPDDELLAFDPVGVLGGLAVEARAGTLDTVRTVASNLMEAIFSFSYK